MTSILTNTAATSALSNLTATQRQLTKTQSQVSSGLAVGTASDNAAYWSIAASMKAQVAALSATQQSLALTSAIANVTTAAIVGVVSLAQGIEADAVTASEAGVDVAAVQKSIAGKQAAIVALVDSASFNGVDWLTSSAHYSVHETITTLQTDAVTQQQSSNATNGASWHTTYTLDDGYTLTDPNGDVSSFEYDQPTENWTTTIVSGTRVASALVRPSPVTSQSGFTGGHTSVDIPFGQGTQGTVMQPVDISRFTLLSNVDTTVTYDEREQYTDQTQVYSNATVPGDIALVGSRVVWGDEHDPGSALLQDALPGSPLAGLLSVDVTTHSGAVGAEQVVTGALDDLTSVAGYVAALQTQVSNMQTFDSSLSDSLTSGIGSLVDADMNVASTRLQALQTQQQLGIQALSIANQNSQLVLKLFQAA